MLLGIKHFNVLIIPKIYINVAFFFHDISLHKVENIIKIGPKSFVILVNHSGISTWSVNKKLQKILIQFLKK